ncbi:hypothetical protein [Lysinibacillus sp. Bpr_S20]|uniref:hypothetical protein n=1 Tax=Lysinibacillus sp. Bpr_S20 TaxID=2933964 RepID=UPI0020131256|nr:hypothetical protein [Lysinibacillus sp. Bpr_S20]MCL1700707.1 hypothetical protein [Lysinibacillus sp. Bpr_S20]
MKNYLFNVMDLKVFDDKGKFITKLGAATKGTLVHTEQDSYFAIKTADFDIELMKAIGEVKDNDAMSDFEKELAPKTTKIKFKTTNSITNFKEFKLIAEGELYNALGEVSREFKIIIDKSILTSVVGINVDLDKVSEFSHVFAITSDDFELELIEK